MLVVGKLIEHLQELAVVGVDALVRHGLSSFNVVVGDGNEEGDRIRGQELPRHGARCSIVRLCADARRDKAFGAGPKTGRASRRP